MADVLTHNPAAIVLRWAGIPITGFGDSDAVKIDPGSDLSTTKVGVDGRSVARSVMFDPTMIVTITLMPHSLAHRQMLSIVALGRANMNGGDVGAFYYRNLNSGHEVTAPKAYVEKMPSIEDTKDPGMMVWVLRIVDAQYAVTP